jgi:Tfp pilus assembly protein FimT
MLVLPRFTSSLAGLDLKTSVQKTSTALRYARSQAVTEQVNYYAVFDLEKNGCIIRAEKPDNEENFYTETRAAAAETVDNPQEQASTVKSYFLPENVRIEKALITDKEIESGFFVIEFYPAGNSSGGAVIFIDAKKRRFKINVDFITGMVDIADPDLSKS